MRLKRSSYYYEAHPRDDSYERKALKDAAEKRRRWGCELLWAYLRREGIPMNHKRQNACIAKRGFSFIRDNERIGKNGELNQSRYLSKPMNDGAWILWQIDL